MRIVVYSKLRLFGESLTRYLSQCSDVDVVEFCPLADRLAAVVRELSAHIVLMDASDTFLFEEARTITTMLPMTTLLAVGISETPEDVIACADAGFVGYVSQRASLEELESVMKQALRGECSCSPNIAASLLQEIRRRQTPRTNEEGVEALTRRESDVLAFVARGHSNKEIARELGLSVATVKNHLHNVFTKLRVSGRTEALARVQSEPWLVRSA